MHDEGIPSDATARQTLRAHNQGQFADAAAGVLQALIEEGYAVDEAPSSVRPADIGAAKILAQWLPMVESSSVRADIVSALGRGWASKISAEPLLREYRRSLEEERSPTSPSTSASRVFAAGSLERVATDRIMPDLMSIARDATQGRERGLIVRALGKAKATKPLVLPALYELISDDEVAACAVIALGKLAGPAAIPQIEPLTRHSDSYIRQESRRALKRLKAMRDPRLHL